MELDEIKKEYAKLEKKYKIPSFKEINEDFDVDKIDRESECFLRLIRKTMMDKVLNSLNFFEMLLNPMNCPRLYMPFVRVMTQEDKKNIEDIYEKLGRLSIEALDLEISYNEKGEAEMIAKICKVWDECRLGFHKVADGIKHPRNGEMKKERSYFG